MGMTDFEKKEFGSAVSNFTKAIELCKEKNSFASNVEEGTHVYLNNRGLAYFFMAEPEYQYALEDFTDAIRLCNDDPMIWFNRGNV